MPFDICTGVCHPPRRIRLDSLISREFPLARGFGDPHAQVSLVQGHLGLGPQEIVFLVVVEFLDLVGIEGLGVETEVRDGTEKVCRTNIRWVRSTSTGRSFS